MDLNELEDWLWAGLFVVCAIGGVIMCIGLWT